LSTGAWKTEVNRNSGVVRGAMMEYFFEFGSCISILHVLNLLSFGLNYICY